MALPGKREQKLKAQEMLMNGLAKTLGYWHETNPNPFHSYADNPGQAAPHLTDEEMEEFGAVLLREADRVAKLFGYDEAWTA